VIWKFTILLALVCASHFDADAQVGIINTIAGTGVGGYCCDGDFATAAEISVPEGLCLDDSGNVLIADSRNSRIRKVNRITGVISTIAGTDSAGYNGDGGLAINSQLNIPVAVKVDDSGNIYVADGLNNRIRKIVVSDGIITTIAGNGLAGYAGDNGLAKNSELYKPSGLCLDKTHHLLYISDCGNNVIRKVNLLSDTITTFAGDGIGRFSGDHGLATNASLFGACEVCTDSVGNLIIADTWNNRVRKVDIVTDTIVTIAGTGVGAYSGDGGLATDEEIDAPAGVFVDKMGNIYLAEYGDGVIQKIDAVTHILTTIAGTGSTGYCCDGEAATDAQLTPTDVCLDSMGSIYIADYNNNRIRKINGTTGVANLAMNQLDNLTISPNPAKDYVEVNGINKNIIYHLTNVLGQEITVGILKVGNSIIDLNNCLPGIYLLTLEDPDDGTKVVKRVVKE